jgi:hypothetical protein
MEQRRTRRFTLKLPVSVVRSGVEQTILAGHTRNISSTGVLFSTEEEPTVTGSIEYVISLNQGQKQPVNLRCLGKVVRLERAENGHREGAHTFHVAATLERYEFVRAR